MSVNIHAAVDSILWPDPVCFVIDIVTVCLSIIFMKYHEKNVLQDL
jgi:hypothetical protein